MFWEEPNSASKVVTIAHQETLGLLLSIFELLLSNLSSDFYYIYSYRTPIQATFITLER